MILGAPLVKPNNITKAGHMVRMLFLTIVLLPALVESAEFAIDTFFGPLKADDTGGPLRVAGQVSWLDSSPIAPVVSLSYWRHTETVDTHAGSQPVSRLQFLALDVGFGARAWSTETSMFGLMGVVAPTIIVARRSDFVSLPPAPAPITSGVKVSWSTNGGVRFGGALLMRTGASAVVRLGFEYLQVFGTVSERNAMLDGGSLQFGFGWGLH